MTRRLGGEANRRAPLFRKYTSEFQETKRDYRC